MDSRTSKLGVGPYPKDRTCCTPNPPKLSTCKVCGMRNITVIDLITDNYRGFGDNLRGGTKILSEDGLGVGERGGGVICT